MYVIIGIFALMCNFVYDFYLDIELQPTRFAYKMAVAKEIVDELFKLL